MKKTTIKNSVIKNFFKVRLENQQNFYLHPSYELEQQLLSCITRGDELAAKHVLDKINKLDRAKLAEEPIRSLKNSIICSCTLFTRAIIKAGAIPEDAFNLSDVYIQQVEKLQSVQEITELEYEMVSSFIATLNIEQQPKYDYIINKTIKYIHQEILHDFSLKQIAEYVDVNPSYLSTKFKKSVGITMKEFINRKRIEESTYFLIHSSSSLSDIANFFSFCNQSYYSSLFKKYLGMSPNQFRSLYSLQNHEDGII